MKAQMKSIIVLVSICAIVAILLGTVNALTAGPIAQAEQTALEQSLKSLYPAGEGFEELHVEGLNLPKTVSIVYRDKTGAYAVKLKTRGFDSDMILLCVIGADGAVVGSECLSSKETLGAEKTYGQTLVGAREENILSVDTVSQATKTTQGYRNAVADALRAVKMVKESGI